MTDEQKIKKVDITPHVSLLPKLGQSGYRVAESLAEFIDNAVDAKLPDQKTVDVHIEMTRDYIKVVDNASGMDEETAINSLKLAYADKKNKLGQFGLGLKTAATSLGKEFVLVTSTKEENNKFILRYNEEEWLKSNDWRSQVLEVRPKDEPEWHGTKITIKKIKFPFYPNKVTNIRDQLARHFATYLRNRLLKIKVNTKYCEAPTFGLVDGEHKIEIETKSGKKITGWYGFLRTRNVGGEYGFDLFKSGRLITKIAKIGFKAHPEVATIVGELNLDFVPTTHNKREFITNSFEYEEAEKAIKKFVEENRITSRARKLSKMETIRKTERKVKSRLEPFFELFREIDEIKNVDKLEKIGRISSEIKAREEIEKIKKSRLFSKEFDIDSLEEGKTYDLEIGGKKYEFEYNFVPLGEEKKWMQYFVDNNKISIIINTDFPLYPFIKDPSTYSLIFISEAISEYITKKYNLSGERVLEIRDFILWRIGTAQRDLKEREKIEQKKKKLLEELKELEQKTTLISST